MPSTLTYPGVYVEEIPSGVRTITGVATSITAFVGRARRGPVNEAIEIQSFAEFERTFGGLWTESTMGYLVADFFRNGGSTAIIVRLFTPLPSEDEGGEGEGGEGEGGEGEGEEGGGEGETTPYAMLEVGWLRLQAKEPGAWGSYLTATVDHEGTADDHFNLTVQDTGPGGRTESYLGLSVDVDSPRYVGTQIAAVSALVDFIEPDDPASLTVPPPGADQHLTALKEKQDARAAAKKALYELPADAPAEDRAAAVTAVKEAQAEIDALVKAHRESVTDGDPLSAIDFAGSMENKTGLYALEQADLFNLLVIPPYKDDNVEPAVLADAAVYCEQRRAMLLIDAPTSWRDKNAALKGFRDDDNPPIPRTRNAALFFPRLREPDQLRDGVMTDVAASGAIAGVFARTDTERGVWKAPAGFDATLKGAFGLTVSLTDLENGSLNPLGVNCLRTMPAAGRVVWGSRTLRGADALADEYKYVPVRRTALYIEESLYRGTHWVVFEPNDEPLWAQIRLNVGAFMHNLFRQGAFQGRTPRDAYFVKCGKETTTQNDINLGIVNIVVGFAPLKPAEFVVIKLQQMAGQIET